MVSYGYKINHANKKEREMKKFMLFAGVMGIVLMSGAAMADGINQIKTATTNTVKKTVYNIQYGVPTGDNDARGYRKGVIPQGNELTTAIGDTAAPVVTGSIDEGGAISVGGSDVAVGQLPATGATPTAANYGTKPTATVTANTANITVLQRDKLVTPGATGSCDNTHPCGYVSTGTHKNTSTDRVWLKVALAADAQ